ncbi:MAG: VOC family protein [Nocardioidaceae bacterium]
MTSDKPVFPDTTASVTPLLAVVDLEASLQFWVKQLGGEVQVRWDTYALVRIGAGQLHLAVAGDAPPDRSIRLVPPDRDQELASGEVVLQVADCRAVVEALLKRGVEFLGPAAEPPWGGEVRAFARDPDGHLVEITSAT